MTRVDMESSMKLSRSAYEVRHRLCSNAVSEAELLGYEQMMCVTGDVLADDVASFERSDDPEASPRCEYSPLVLPPRSDSLEDLQSTRSPSFDEISELGDPLDRATITRCLCASVLFYDVMAFLA